MTAIDKDIIMCVQTKGEYIVTGLRSQLWDLVCEEYRVMGGNKTQLAKRLGVSKRGLRSWFSGYRKGKDPSIRPKIGSALWLWEREIILDALRQENGHQTRAALRLGIDSRVIRLKLATYKETGFGTM